MQKAILLCVLTIVFISGCTGGTVPPDSDLPTATELANQLTPEEQQTMAEKLFTEILDLTLTTNDRREIFNDMERLYLEIINKYPEAHLVHEAHVRLIKLYLVVEVPGNLARAEKLYQDYCRKYPDSTFRDRIRETIDKKRAELETIPR